MPPDEIDAERLCKRPVTQLRYLDLALSFDVLRELDHSEEKVKLFYNHLDDKMQQLQDEIAQG
jgi:hypothetical protein